MAKKPIRTISMLHSFREIDTMFYFYDGETTVSQGVISIPVDRPEWVQRAYIMGYRRDPATREGITLEEFLSK